MSEKITWEDYRIASDFTAQPKHIQDDLKDRLLHSDAMSNYNFMRVAVQVVEHMDDKQAKQLLSNYISNSSQGRLYSYHSRGSDVFDIVKNVAKRDPEFTKAELMASSDKKIKKALLVIPSLSLDEEVAGLRGLATGKYCPDAIYNAKYRPSMEALSKLPSVMRLNVLEALLSNQHLGYSIFDKVTDEDSFKLLLFSSTLRHRDRVEEVWNAYKITKTLGLRAKVSVTAMCDNCGEYTVDITSARTSAPGMLKKTYLGRLLTKNRCALCGRYTTDKPVLKGGIAGAA